MRFLHRFMAGKRSINLETADQITKSAGTDAFGERQLVKASSPPETKQQLATRMLDRAFGGALDRLMASALAHRPPTPSEITKLQALLAEIESKRKGGGTEGMNPVFDFLTEHGPMLTVGASVALAFGLLGVAVVRQPVHKQRLAETTILGTLLWLILAIAPLPRSAAKPSEPMSLIDSSLPVERASILESSPSPIPMLPTAERVALTKPVSFEAIAESPQAPIAKSIEFSSEAELLPDPPKREPIPFGRIAVITLLASTVLACLALLVAWIRLRILVWRSASPDPRTLDVWEKLEPPRQARLLVAPRDSIPMSFGVFKSTVASCDVDRRKCCRAGAGASA